MVLILKVLRCCMWCLKKCLEFLNKMLIFKNIPAESQAKLSGGLQLELCDHSLSVGKSIGSTNKSLVQLSLPRNAYIQMAIRGESFCMSAKTVGFECPCLGGVGSMPVSVGGLRADPQECFAIWCYSVATRGFSSTEDSGYIGLGSGPLRLWRCILAAMPSTAKREPPRLLHFWGWSSTLSGCLLALDLRCERMRSIQLLMCCR